ncbi:centaurin-gamma-1A-like isoform X1 [Penaeus monodon]|uniref:centaurin-gamma-1A-like isoform X1 n=1 Tax=Penaeus monodon TaxID=6687 RepID=UPI0018A7DA1A|nr:centaurin-gamma-1A-like isoform X1 [Penaeus monodon]
MKYGDNFVRSMRRSLRIKKSKSVTITNNNTIKRKSDSFVNSQEWTLSRGVPDLRLGIVGSLSSGKSALVHRYLTGSYMQEESPEGGRFKKEIVLDGQSYLLLIRDEGGPPELQFTAWVDAVIFVFSLENESSFNAIYNYYAKMAHYRNTTEVPLILVGTQDGISENNPRVIDDGRARKLASDLKRCSYYETCATYGLNVERVFHDACSKIVAQRLSQQGLTPNNSRPGTPTHLLRYPSTNNGYTPAPYSNISAPLTPQITSSQQVTPPISGSSPSHMFTNTVAKDGTLRSSHGSGAELTAMTRTDSFRDDGFKRVSAPGAVTSATFMAPPPPPTTTPAPATIMDAIPAPRDSKDLPTPSSTPTTSRKSRRKSNLFTPSKKSDEKEKNKNGEVGSGRAIPIKQGYLYKKSNKALNKDWKKKYVTLCDNGRLTYHPSLHDYMEDVHGKEISLQYTTVKVPGMKPRGSKVVPGSGGSDPLSAEMHTLNIASVGTPGPPLTGRSSLGGPLQSNKDKQVTLTSYETLHDPAGVNGLDSASISSKIETPNVKKRHRRMKSSGNKNAECEDSDGYEFSLVSLDNKQWHFEAGSQEERDEWVSAIEQQILYSLQGNESNKSKTRQGHPIDAQTIATLKNQVPGNLQCVDCDAPNPEWASINLGVLMCIECSGIHRNLGSHISKVRSLDLDEWPPGPLSVMMSLGNEVGNSVWEAHTRGQAKPNPRSSREDKERWIRAKYEAKEFIAMPQSGIPLNEQIVDCVCRGDVQRLSALLPHAGDAVNSPLAPHRDLRTPLHLAAAFPSLSCVQLLLWYNASVKICDAEGRSSLFYARTAGDKEVIDLLLQNGCPDSVVAAPPITPHTPALSHSTFPLSTTTPQPSTLPRRKGSISRKPEMLDKLQASVI